MEVVIQLWWWSSLETNFTLFNYTNVCVCACATTERSKHTNRWIHKTFKQQQTQERKQVHRLINTTHTHVNTTGESYHSLLPNQHITHRTARIDGPGRRSTSSQSGWPQHLVGNQKKTSIDAKQSSGTAHSLRFTHRSQTKMLLPVARKRSAHFKHTELDAVDDRSIHWEQKQVGITKRDEHTRMHRWKHTTSRLFSVWQRTCDQMIETIATDWLTNQNTHRIKKVITYDDGVQPRHTNS